MDMKKHSNIDVSILTDNDEHNWQGYVDSHPDATIYHTLEWRDILYSEYRFEHIYLMAKERGKVVGVLPMFLIKNLRGRRLISLPFSIYGGPLVDTNHVISALFIKCVEMVDEGKANSVEIKPFKYIDCPDNIGFQTLDWGLATVMDLEIGHDALWEGLAERFNVLKAVNKGLCFFLTEGGRLQEFYQLQLMTRKRLGLPTPAFSYYASFFEKLPGRVKLAIVEKDGIAIAGDMFFIFKDKVLLCLNVSDSNYRDCKPNDFMIWNIVKWACESGFKSLDPGPTSYKDKGLLHFKGKWGGASVKAFRYYYPAFNKEISSSKGSIFFRLMPRSMAALVGSKVIKKIG